MNIENWWLEEYRQLKRDWEIRTSQEQTLINYSILVLAGVASFVGLGPFTSFGPWQPSILFVFATVFFALAFFYFRHDIFIAYTGRYINTVLLPKLGARYRGQLVLEWHAFLTEQHGHGFLRIAGQIAAVGICSLPITGAGTAFWIWGVSLVVHHARAVPTILPNCQIPLLSSLNSLHWAGIVSVGTLATLIAVVDIFMMYFCYRERVRTLDSGLPGSRSGKVGLPDLLSRE